jgi:hypothetical protein
MAKVSSHSKKNRQIDALKKKIEKFDALCTKLRADLQLLETNATLTTNNDETPSITST